ncbi:flavin reductase family protein [Rhodobacteraceae bacterium ASV31]|nr:flavin reductase family protein [Anianabacter salinae]
MQTITPSPDDPRALRDALGRFATGVTVITTASDIGPLGITANSFASVSLDPPLVLWSPARASKRFAAYAEAKHYAIHILGAEQEELSRHFATQGSDFSGIDWAPGAHETPLIEGCLARFECTPVAVHDGGDHVIVVGRVDRASWRDGAPLLFLSGTFGRFARPD